MASQVSKTRLAQRPNNVFVGLSRPKLPFELLLEIASYLPVSLRLQMSKACRTWYHVLFPYKEFKNVFIEKWTRFDGPEAEQRMVVLTDSLRIGKHDFVDRLVFHAPAYMLANDRYYLKDRLAILGLCTWLTHLEIARNVLWVTVLEDLSKCAPAFANVTSLILNIAAVHDTGKFDFPFPALKTLGFYCEPHAALFRAIIRDSLCSPTLIFTFTPRPSPLRWSLHCETSRTSF